MGLPTAIRIVPPKDDTRAKVVFVMMQAFKTLADEGKLAT